MVATLAALYDGAFVELSLVDGVMGVVDSQGVAVVDGGATLRLYNQLEGQLQENEGRVVARGEKVRYLQMLLGLVDQPVSGQIEFTLDANNSKLLQALAAAADDNMVDVDAGSLAILAASAALMPNTVNDLWLEEDQAGNTVASPYMTSFFSLMRSLGMDIGEAMTSVETDAATGRSTVRIQTSDLGASDGDALSALDATVSVDMSGQGLNNIAELSSQLTDGEMSVAVNGRLVTLVDALGGMLGKDIYGSGAAAGGAAPAEITMPESAPAGGEPMEAPAMATPAQSTPEPTEAPMEDTQVDAAGDASDLQAAASEVVPAEDNKEEAAEETSEEAPVVEETGMEAAPTNATEPAAEAEEEGEVSEEETEEGEGEVAPAAGYATCLAIALATAMFL